MHQRGELPAGGGHHRATSWTWVLGAFVLAGVTGVAFRLGLLGLLPGSLELGDVRHAHSHLMFFGWAAPALMLLIADRLRAVTGSVRALRRSAGWALAAGFAAYPVFLVSGYGTVALLGRPVPLSVAVASLNAVAWVAFAVAYVRATRGVPRDRTLRLWDTAVGFLLLAPAGAMARGVADAVGAEAFWSSSAIHAFLGWFADGWLMLGVLGLAWHVLGGNDRLARVGHRLVVAGLPLSVLAWSSPQGRPAGVGLLAALAAAAVGIGVVLIVAAILLPRLKSLPRTVWLVPLAALAVRGVAEPLGVLGGGAPPAGDSVRILYLHVMLLGGVSTGFVTALAAEDRGAARYLRAWWISVGLLLASLAVLISPVAAQSLTGRWLAVAAAVGPVAVAMAILLARLRGGREGRRGEPVVGMPESSRLEGTTSQRNEDQEMVHATVGPR